MARFVTGRSQQEDPSDLASARERYSSALKVFRDRGQRLLREGISHGFYFALYSKSNGAEPVVRSGQDGDLAWIVGTPIHRGSLLETLGGVLERPLPATPRSTLTGAYVIVRLTSNGIEIETDRVGSLPVYCTSDDVVTTSFLAAAFSVGSRTLDRQGFYEYVLTGAQYGEATYIKEVHRLDSCFVHRIGQSRQALTLPRTVQPVAVQKRSALIEQSLALIRDYFGSVVSQFGDSIATGITAGYDSRLILAALSDQGVRPMLMVRGRDSHIDVRVAKMIAAALGLELYHSNEATARVNLRGLQETVRRRLVQSDGLSHTGAVGWRERSDSCPSAEEESFRTKALVLNGGGGEIFRDYWELPDSTFDVADVIRHGVEWKTHALRRHATSRFDAELFFGNLERKMLACLQASSPSLSRGMVSLAYPYFRVRHWTMATLQAHQTARSALLPYTDARMVSLACSIPAPLRYEGAFEGDLILHLSRQLAGLPSGYGESFARSPSLTRRASGLVRRRAHLLPSGLLFYLRNVIESEDRKTGSGYPDPRLRLELFGETNLAVEEFFDCTNASDPRAVNRALSVECVLRGVGVA